MDSSISARGDSPLIDPRTSGPISVSGSSVRRRISHRYNPRPMICTSLVAGDDISACLCFISSPRFLPCMLPPLPRARCLSLLGLCSSKEQVKQVHAQLITNSLLGLPSAVAKLIDRYFAVADGEGYARLIFKHHAGSSAVVSNAMVRHSRPEEASTLFSHQIRRGLVMPDCFIYTYVLRSCAQLHSLRGGMQVHGCIVKSGFTSDVAVGTTAIHFYASCKDIESARQLFGEMTMRNAVTWNALMTGCCLNNCAKDALFLFNEMLQQGLETTDRTAIALLSACSQLGNLALGSSAHVYIYKTVAYHQDCVFIGTGLVDMYSKCGCLTSALRMFDRMRDRNVLTWSAMIAGLAIHGNGKAALELLDDMEKEGLSPNAVTFTSLLSACCHRGLVNKGLYLFDAMKSRFGVEPCMQHYGCMVDLLGRAGMVEEAYECVRRMQIEPDAVVWRALLGACRIHKHEKLGEEIGKILLQLEKESRLTTDTREDYIALSNIYASAERWEDVSTLRQAMKKIAAHRPGWSAV